MPIADTKSDDEFMPQDNCTYCGSLLTSIRSGNIMFSYEQIALDLRKRTMPPTQPSAQHYEPELPAGSRELLDLLDLLVSAIFA